jgi:hypothetical protein
MTPISSPTRLKTTQKTNASVDWRCQFNGGQRRRLAAVDQQARHVQQHRADQRGQEIEAAAQLLDALGHLLRERRRVGRHPIHGAHVTIPARGLISQSDNAELGRQPEQQVERDWN